MVSLRSASSDSPEYNPRLNQPGFPAEFLASQGTPAEGGSPVTITATLNQPAPDGGTGVALTTGGTAVKGTDYTLSPASIHIAKGERTGTATLTVIDDALADANETVTVGAVSINPELFSDIALNFIIADNDGANSIGDNAGATPAQLSSDAGLRDLYVSGHPFTQSFAPARTEYAATVGPGQSQLYLRARVNHPEAAAAVTGARAVNGGWFIVALAPRPACIAVVVTAEDGATTRTYAIGLDGQVAGPACAPAQSAPPPQNLDPPGSYSVTATASAAEGSDAALTITLSKAAPADGVAFTVTAGYGGSSTATSADVGSVASPVTVALGKTALDIAIPTVGDAVDEDDETFTVTVAAAATGWTKSGDGKDTATVTITDDDTAGVTVTPATLNIAEDGSAAYSVVLGSQPTADVVVTPASSDGGAASFAPASHTFTPSAWNTAKTFTVSGVADADTGDEAVSIRHGVASNDAKYGGTAADVVAVTVADSTETYSVTSAASAAEGSSAALTITLSEAAPAGGVAFTVTAGYGGSSTAASGDVGSITSPVTVLEGNTTLDIAIPTVGDAVDEDNETFTVTVATAASGWVKAGDGKDTATVTITDDDTAGVTVSPTTLNVSEDGSAAYSVVLDSQPTADVYVLLEISVDGAVDVSQSDYAFTPDNWNTAHTYTVSGLSDDDRDDESVTISHSAYSIDPGYNEIAVASVSATVKDTTPEPEKQVKEPELPGPVVGLELSAKGKKVTVSWQAPASGDTPDNYIVHLKPEQGDKGSGQIKRPKAGKTSVTFRSLEKGATYNVWVRAQNEAGKSERVHASITLPE